MTIRRTVVWLPILLAAEVMLGAVAARAPKVALVIGLGVLVLTAAAYGAPAALGTVLVLFPVLPSSFSGALGTNSLNPQRLLVGFLLVILLISPSMWAKNRWRLQALRRPLRYMTGFLAIGVLSAAVSPLPGSALAGVGFYGLQLFGVMVAACLLADRKQTDRYLMAVSVASILVGLLAVIEYFAPHGGLSHVLGPVYSSSADTSGIRALPRRVSGPLANPVSLGDFSVLTLPVVLRAAASDARRCARLGTVAALSLVVAIMLSQTRMAMLALPIALGIWFIASDHRRRAATTVVTASLVVAVAFGGAVLTTEAAILGTALSYRGQTTSANPGQQNVYGRTSIYITGARAFAARPVLGYGFRVPTEHAQAPFFTRFGEPYAFESYLVVVPLEGGLLGVLALIGVFASLLAAVRHRVSAARDRAPIYATVAAGAALALASTPFDTEVTYFWLLLGLMLGIGLRRPGEPA